MNLFLYYYERLSNNLVHEPDKNVHEPDKNVSVA
jgi:hypothetical protein